VTLRYPPGHTVGMPDRAATIRRNRRFRRKPRPVLVTPDRLLVARVIADRGPLWGDALAEACGLSLVRFWAAVCGCPWFALEGPGYHLTDRGRAEGLA